MSDTEKKADESPQRLCSEIQLFDLCDLSSCRFKSGRFCTDPALLERFEKIADQEMRTPENYLDEESEDDFEDGDDSYGDFYSDGESDPEDE